MEKEIFIAPTGLSMAAMPMSIVADHQSDESLLDAPPLRTFDMSTRKKPGLHTASSIMEWVGAWAISPDRR
jgi:hypothetical protein